ncbi:hypothetical protein AV530_005711 [Patagioenas fasciata monilis]|uniref:Uncharacterized protein n=1 Tax=Patagioenas fasciata monilis TaxID=372326 RepID=A0A1V4JMA9_PATFA|nr:hypothetical protein AV530_005711 [Patagioenas fasciata monilis]
MDQLQGREQPAIYLVAVMHPFCCQLPGTLANVESFGHQEKLVLVLMQFIQTPFKILIFISQQLLALNVTSIHTHVDFSFLPKEADTHLNKIHTDLKMAENKLRLAHLE